MAAIKTAFEVKTITLLGSKRLEETETILVVGSGQRAANAVDKKFKGKLFKKFFKGLMINDSFIPFVAPSIFS